MAGKRGLVLTEKGVLALRTTERYRKFLSRHLDGGEREKRGGGGKGGG